uniref:IFT52 GIFT domain-containing protein n=1 Tax=Parascaris equorum TaxID=6256 RepID=A0A914RGD8_PAREQ
MAKCGVHPVKCLSMYAFFEDVNLNEQLIADAVIRTIFYKYFEPKEALISNGVLNRAISSAAGKTTRHNDDENNAQYAL